MVAADARPPAEPIPGGVQSISDLIAERAKAHPARDALIDSRQRLSYAEVESLSRRWAYAYHALGLRAGNRVASSMGNSVELVMSHLAAMRAGLVWVGVNRALAAVERDEILRDSGASVLLVSGAELEVAGGCRVVDAGGDAWRRLVAAAPSVDLPTIDPFAAAAIAYTSGTTGRPKGVVHSQRNMLLPGVVARARGEGEGRIGMYLPLTSLNMQVLGPVYALVNGVRCVCIEQTDAASVVAAVEAEGIERMSATAATVYDLVVGEKIMPSELASLGALTVGGSSTPDWLVDAYFDKFGARFLSGYGLTEAPGSVTRERADRAHVLGSAGPALAQFELAVIDDDGRVLPAGEVGEICLRASTTGPFARVYTPMLGYWNQPEASAAALRAGWLHTGDIGRLGADGDLFVEDRRDDLIVRGGTNVYPAEIERVLLADERVAHCAVVARSDLRLGQLPVAFVQLRPGASMSTDDVLALCVASLAKYEVPVDVRFVTNFTRNAMGKIVRAELRTLLRAEGFGAPRPVAKPSGRHGRLG